MAIQLNDRDHLIFKLIDEHQVLLEKHISWFISGDDKPVLIRDRLRKLFYLDYLLCHRHGTKLPWWTTPTKPLVYMLSSMTRNIAGFAEDETTDLFDANVQRHLLEVANLRMMHLIGVKEGDISAFEWTTVKGEKTNLDAKVSFQANGKAHKLGIINHPACGPELIAQIDAAMKSDGIESVLLVSRDETHQASMQSLLSASSVGKHCVFATHHELYKAGIVKSKWACADQKTADIFASTVINSEAWSGSMTALAM
jgi:hypothetical protein